MRCGRSFVVAGAGENVRPQQNAADEIVIGFEEITFTELADRHAGVWKALA